MAEQGRAGQVGSIGRPGRTQKPSGCIDGGWTGEGVVGNYSAPLHCLRGLQCLGYTLKLIFNCSSDAPLIIIIIIII